MSASTNVLTTSRQPRPSWNTVFIALMILAVLGRSYFGGMRGELFSAAALALFSLKILHGLASCIQRLRKAWRESRRGLELCKEVLPPWLRGVVATEGKIYREVFSRIFGLEAPSTVEARKIVSGTGFTLSRGDVFPLLVPMAIIGLLADLPLSQIVILIWHPRHALLVHAVTLLLAIWGLVWILGDRWAVRAIDHSLGEQDLSLRVGFRWACDMPISAIRQCLPLSGAPHEWQETMQIDKSSVWRVTPIDPPNVLLEIDSDRKSDVRIVRLGATVEPRKFLAMYVDSPSEFIRCVNGAIGVRE